MMSEFNTIIFDKNARIAILALKRPDALNALVNSRSMLEAS